MALPPSPALSAFTQTLYWVRRPIPFMEELAADLGDCFTIKLLQQGNVVCISQPETIRQIFAGDPAAFHAGEAAKILEPLVGANSVLLLDGATHMRQRKLMLPSFHGERMKAYAEAMRDVTSAIMSRWPTDRAFSLQPYTQQITLDVIIKTVFGIDDATRMKQLGDQLTEIIELGTRPRALIAVLPALGARLRAQFARKVRKADTLIYDEIRRRRDRGDFSSHTDVMSLLLSATDEDGRPMTDEELRDELVTLLVAGHETTATSLAWTFERVLSHRAVYDRLVEEIRDTVGDQPVGDEHLNRLPYLDATVRESLRLRPIIPMVVRRVQVPVSIRGFDVPAGTIVSPNIYLTHRRPDLYPEPNEFRPERFIDVRPKPYHWLPFGGGVRRCLGIAFALYEMKVVMATILAKTDITLAPGSSDRMARRGITFSPSDGSRVVVNARAAA